MYDKLMLEVYKAYAARLEMALKAETSKATIADMWLDAVEEALNSEYNQKERNDGRNT